MSLIQLPRTLDRLVYLGRMDDSSDAGEMLSVVSAGGGRGLGQEGVGWVEGATDGFVS